VTAGQNTYGGGLQPDRQGVEYNYAEGGIGTCILEPDQVFDISIGFQLVLRAKADRECLFIVGIKGSCILGSIQ
jgi:hypothetical protein